MRHNFVEETVCLERHKSEKSELCVENGNMFCSDLLQVHTSGML